jgi:hypothetical protein
MVYTATIGAGGAVLHDAGSDQGVAAAEAAKPAVNTSGRHPMSKNQAKAQRQRGYRCMHGPFDPCTPPAAAAGGPICIDQDVCAALTHPIWKPANSELLRFIRARMEKKVALNLHFPDEYLQQKGAGSNCFGMNVAWRRLHQARPDAPPAKRMELMMSKDCIAYAVGEHERYMDAWESRKAARLDELELGFMTWAELDTEVIAAAGPIDAKLISDEVFCTREDFEGLGASLSEQQGYYEIRIGLGEELHAHVLDVYWEEGASHFTIFDSNLGENEALSENETLVETNELYDFMAALSDFYQQNYGLRIEEVKNVYKVEFTTPVSETPLAGLAAELAR